MRYSTAKRHLPIVAAAGAASVLFAHPARAQYIDTFLPPSVPGFDQSQGVTVQSRQRPLYQPGGVRVGSFNLRGGVDEQVGYDTNITGTSTARSSGFIQTSPSVSAESDWSRNRLGFAAALDNFTYFSAPRLSNTNYTVAVGGGLTILRNTLDLGYSHVHGNEFGTDAGAVAFDTPVPFDADVIRSAYTLDVGRLRFTPNIDLRLFQYGNATFAGVPINQNFRDRTVVQGGVTTSYSLAEQRSLVLVVQGSQSHYIRPQTGALSNNSQSILILPGIDYQTTGPFRFRLLAGVEVRNFEAAQFGTRTAPIFEGSVIYTPTGLTTVTTSLRRAIEDTSAEGASGFTDTGLSVQVDHEYRRNILFQAFASYRHVDYYQNLGSSDAEVIGAGATWLLNRSLSAFATYRFARQEGSGSPGFGTTGLGTAGFVASGFNNLSALPSFSRNVGIVGLRWRL